MKTWYWWGEDNSVYYVRISQWVAAEISCSDMFPYKIDLPLNWEFM